MQDLAPRYLRVDGDHHDLGFQHGQAYREQIESFLGDHLARIQLLRHTPLCQSDLEHHLECYWREVQHHLPDVAKELAGLAEGAGIPLKLACLLQFRRELIGYRKIPTLGDCSTIAARGARPYVAQTIDLSGDMSPLATVVHTQGAAVGSPDILMFTFKGLLGYLGMNSAGLCVGINVVLSGEWGHGVSPYLTVRQMLACRSVDECLTLIRALPHASSRSFTLLDRHRLVAVEFAAGTVKVMDKPLSTHTNHFLDAELARGDEINILSRNSSRKRLALLDEYAMAHDHTAQVEGMFELLSNHSLYPHGLCVHNQGDLRREETVGAVLMLPDEGRMLVRFGHPCEASTETFSL
jgi:isopenicillin-N N-acyltransferase-like protein